VAAAAPVSSDHEPVNPAVRQLAMRRGMAGRARGVTIIGVPAWRLRVSTASNPTAGQLAPDEVADVLLLVKYNVA
jgi:hypothetical protein